MTRQNAEEALPHLRFWKIRNLWKTWIEIVQFWSETRKGGKYLWHYNSEYKMIFDLSGINQNLSSCKVFTIRNSLGNDNKEKKMRWRKRRVVDEVRGGGSIIWFGKYYIFGQKLQISRKTRRSECIKRSF